MGGAPRPEERAMLARRMALKARQRKSFHTAARFAEQAEARENHARVLRKMLLEEEKPDVLTGERSLAEGTHD